MKKTSTDVRRWYSKSRDNFLNHYRFLADYWYIFDNSVAPLVMVAKGQYDNEVIFYKARYDKIKA